VAPDDFAEIAAATGAMLVGRRTWEVGDRMEAEEPGSVDYPFSGPMFLLTHRPLEPPDPEVTTGGRPDFGRSSSPAMPSVAKRRFQPITAGLLNPTRRTISPVPTPSAANSTTRAR
jgi:hypothetical protein